MMIEGAAYNPDMPAGSVTAPEACISGIDK